MSIRPLLDDIRNAIAAPEDATEEELVGILFAAWQEASTELARWREAVRLTDEYTAPITLGSPLIHWARGWTLYDAAHPNAEET